MKFILDNWEIIIGIPLAAAIAILWGFISFVVGYKRGMEDCESLHPILEPPPLEERTQ